MSEDTKNAWKTFTEEIEVSGQHLLTEINRLIAEGNVRKLVVKTDDGQVFVTIPLTAGAVAGGLVALSAPWLAIIAAVAGLMVRVKIEIVRETPPADISVAQQAAPPADTAKH